jgi:hypothetical protein
MKAVASPRRRNALGRLEVIDDGDERFGPREVDAGQSPQEQNGRLQKPERGVEIEIHPLPAARRIEEEALVPGAARAPPDDDAVMHSTHSSAPPTALTLRPVSPVKQVVVEIVNHSMTATARDARCPCRRRCRD